MPVIMPREEQYENVPPGSYGAICYRVVDLGTQWSDLYQNAQHKIMISWEMPNDKMADGRPYSIHKFYTLSSSKKSNLRIALEAWRGRAFTQEEMGSFDIGKLIGVPCMLGVVLSDKGRSVVSSLMKLPKEMPAPIQVNEGIYFSLDEFNQDTYNKLSDTIKAMIAKSPEYAKAKGLVPAEAHHHDDELSDSIPF